MSELESQVPSTFGKIPLLTPKLRTQVPGQKTLLLTCYIPASLHGSARLVLRALRNGRKSLTTVQGLKKEYSYRKILKDLKKEFCCNGTVVQDPELGQVIQLQGDQRKNISSFLVQAGIVKKENIKLHGL